MKPSN